MHSQTNGLQLLVGDSDKSLILGTRCISFSLLGVDVRYLGATGNWIQLRSRHREVVQPQLCQSLGCLGHLFRLLHDQVMLEESRK